MPGTELRLGLARARAIFEPQARVCLCLFSTKSECFLFFESFLFFFSGLYIYFCMSQMLARRLHLPPFDPDWALFCIFAITIDQGSSTGLSVRDCLIFFIAT